MFIVFLPTFCQKGLSFDKVTTSVYVLVTIVTYAVSALAGGYLGDIIGNKRTQALGIILAIIILIPLSISLLTKSAVALLFIVLFAIVNGLINANYMIVVLNRFDKLQRFSGLAITQNISMAIFMGVLPALFAFLVADLKILSAPFYILFVLYIVALMSLFD